VSDLDLTDLEARLIGERNGGFDNDEVRALIREAREARRLREVVAQAEGVSAWWRKEYGGPTSGEADALTTLLFPKTGTK
jgi:hypothetical protein